MSVGVQLSPSDGLIFTILRFQLGRGENEREHWTTRARRVKKERGRIAWAMCELRLRGQLKLPNGPPWDVHLVRLTPDHAGCDDDAVVAGFKAVRDQIAEELGCKRSGKGSDGDRSVIRFTYDQETRAQWGVRIEIRTRQPSPGSER